jgi:hypothetical protein
MNTTIAPEHQAAPSRPPVAGAPANDAFSFWKLPESWRAPLGPGAIAQSRIISEWYLLERYRADEIETRRLSLGLYYSVKEFIPVQARHFTRSLQVRIRRLPQFPKWPCEDALLAFHRDWVLRAAELTGERDGWHIGWWPGNNARCVVLTHDVESAAGFERMEAISELEERYGFRSAWNLPLDQYPIDWKRVEALRARGFEFGAHGLRHDGMLFRSRRHFLALAPRVQSLAREHGLRAE